MLENIRKYSALMIIVVALLAFGLIMTLRDSAGAGASKGDIVIVNNRGLTDKELNIELQNPGNILGRIDRQNVNSPGAQLLRQLALERRVIGYPKIDDRWAPAITHLLIQEEAEKLGIFVSQLDAEKFIREELFVDAQGEKDDTRYSEFEKEGLKNLGMNPRTFKNFIANILTMQKVKEIKTIHRLPYSTEFRQQELFAQYLNTVVVQLKFEDFKDEAKEKELTDIILKEFYEAEKNGATYGQSHFRTKPKVKLTYVPVNLDPIPLLDPDKKNQALVTSQQILQEGDYQNFRDLLNNEDLFGDKPDLEALAKKHNLTVKKTELINDEGLSSHFDNVPLTGEYARRSEATGQQLMLYDYLLSPNIKPAKKLQLQINGAYNNKSFIYYRRDGVEEARLKTFEEAKEGARKLKIKIDQRNRMEAAAEKVREALEKAVADGTDIKEAIKGIKGNPKLITIEKLTSRTNNKDLEIQASNLFMQSFKLPKNGVSEVISDDDAAAVVLVKNRAIEKVDPEAKKPNEYYSGSNEFMNPMFGKNDYAREGYYEWLLQAYEKAKADDKVTVPAESTSN